MMREENIMSCEELLQLTSRIKNLIIKFDEEKLKLEIVTMKELAYRRDLRDMQSIILKANSDLEMNNMIFQRELEKLCREL